MYKRIPYYNLEMNIMELDEAHQVLSSILEGDSTETLYFVNAHCFNVAWKNEVYRDALNKSSLVFNDGVGIELGAKVSGIHIPTNLNGTDLIPDIIKMAWEKGLKIYLLGAKPGVAARAAQKLAQKYDGLRVAGFHDGYFDSESEKKIIREINDKNVDVLIVGMGVPAQELWIKKNKDKLSCCRLVIAGGAILDFISENVKRAPDWMKSMKIEWVYRLVLEPGRMWKRYLLGNNLFFWHIIKYKFSNKKT